MFESDPDKDNLREFFKQEALNFAGDSQTLEVRIYLCACIAQSLGN